MARKARKNALAGPRPLARLQVTCALAMPIVRTTRTIATGTQSFGLTPLFKCTLILIFWEFGAGANCDGHAFRDLNLLVCLANTSLLTIASSRCRAYMVNMKLFIHEETLTLRHPLPCSCMATR